MKEFLYKYFNKNLVDEVLNSNKYHRIYGINNSPVSKENNINIDLCIKLYVDYKLPIYKIAMLYGISDGTMRTYFLKHGINLKGHKVGKNSFNNYFEKIDSPDKAYFLGLIVSDGNIWSCKNKKRLQISLTETDGYILKRFNKYADFHTELIVNHKNDEKPRLLLSIHSEKIYNDLINLGIQENKSHKTTHIPDISQELIPHFIRGYFDGDGIAKSNGYIGFCGSYDIINEIKNELLKHCDVKNNKITFNKTNHIYYIQWASKKDRYNIFNYLYNNKQDLYLKRKYEKIKNNLQGPSYSDV